MRVGLTHANAVIQLGGNVVVLVRGNVVLLHEWTVMRCDHCDVRIFSFAELCVAVAGLGVHGTRGS